MGEQGDVSKTCAGVGDVVVQLGVARNSPSRWIKRCGLPARALGRLLGFKLSAVDARIGAGSGGGVRPVGPHTIRSAT